MSWQTGPTVMGAIILLLASAMIFVWLVWFLQP